MRILGILVAVFITTFTFAQVKIPANSKADIKLIIENAKMAIGKKKKVLIIPWLCNMSFIPAVKMIRKPAPVKIANILFLSNILVTPWNKNSNAKALKNNR